jgi:hypothetical protein
MKSESWHVSLLQSQLRLHLRPRPRHVFCSRKGGGQTKGYPQPGNRPPRKTHYLCAGGRLARVPACRYATFRCSFVYSPYVPSAPDPPLASLPPYSSNVRQFLGEDTPIGTPAASSRSRTASGALHTPPSAPSGFGAGVPDPSIWSEEQQRQLMNALMGAAGTAPPRFGQPPQSQATDETALPEDNPLAALMAMMPQQGEQGGAGMPPGAMPPNLFGQPPAQPMKRTLLQKVMPIIHLIAGWMLLAFFVLWREPQAFEARPHASSQSGSAWRRWAELGWRRPENSWGVQFVVRPAVYVRFFIVTDVLGSLSSGRLQLSLSFFTPGGYSRDW